MITGLAHTALHVPDVEAAVAWYRDVLGLRVLSPPFLMEGDAISADMGELLPSPVAVKASIVGAGDDTDQVIEVVEYPNLPTGAGRADIAPAGYTHVGLVCDDIDATRTALEAQGVTFLTQRIADVAGLRTTWFADPWGNVFILMQKVRRPGRPYYRQFG